MGIRDLLHLGDDTPNKNTSSASSETNVISFPGVRAVEHRLRPTSLSDIVGQAEIKANLHVAMKSAQRRKRVLGHCFFYGPPGLGKTTFAASIASEMGCAMYSDTGPQLTVEYVTQRILSHFQTSPLPVVWFVDEAHGIPKDTMTLLLPVIEDFQYGSPDTEMDALKLPEFTFIAATTDPHKVIAPLRERMKLTFQLSYYTTEELMQILKRSYRVLMDEAEMEVDLSDHSAHVLDLSLHQIAQRAMGVPRRANNYLERALDFVWASDDLDLQLNPDIVRTAMTSLGIDKHGLDKKSREVLVAMLQRYGNRPVGMRAIASTIGEDAAVLETVIEPSLVRLGFVNREQRGRTLTPDGCRVAALAMEGMMEE